MENTGPGRLVPSLGGGSPPDPAPTPPRAPSEQAMTLLRRIAGGQAQILERLAALEDRQQEVASEIDDRLSELETAIQDLSDRFDDLPGDDLGSAVEGLSDAMSDMRSALDDLGSTVSGI